MNTIDRDEREIGLLVRESLNHSTASLPAPATERLFAARQAALARHTAIQDQPSLLGAGRHVLAWCEDRARPLLFALGLALALAGGPFVLQLPNSDDDLVALDTALLTDELPIDAYLDSGFHSWLADSSRR